MAKATRKSTPTDKAVANRKQAEPELQFPELQSPERHAQEGMIRALGVWIQEQQAAFGFDPKMGKRIDAYLADPFGIKALVVDELKPEKSRGRKPQRHPQVERVRRVLPELFPNGTDEIPTATVKGKVEEYLAQESKRLGLDSKRLGLTAPGWDAVKRALGRDLKK